MRNTSKKKNGYWLKTRGRGLNWPRLGAVSLPSFVFIEMNLAQIT